MKNQADEKQSGRPEKEGSGNVKEIANMILTHDERESLGRMASSCYPGEWGAAGHAAEMLRCVNDGVAPSPKAIEWFLRRYRTAETGRTL